MAQEQGKGESDLSQPPTEKILAMRNQNLSNNEIIHSLQNEGYNSDIILDGMNQADLKSRVEDSGSQDSPQNISNPMQFSPSNSQSSPGQQNTQQNSFSAPEQSSFQQNESSSQQEQGLLNEQPSFDSQAPPSTPQNMPPPMGQSQGFQGTDQVSIERIEEIAEAIIDEKWNEIVKSINKIIDWKERTEGNINKLEQKFEDLKREFDNLNKGVLGKISEYDKNLGNLGVEIKAMERVFQKIIPTMTENVHALQKLTDKLTDKTEEKK